MFIKFQGFTSGANEVMSKAVEAASGLGHDHIGSEHLLYALAQRIDLGVDAGEILSYIAKNEGTGLPRQLSPELMTPHLKNIIQNAYNIGGGYVNEGHLAASMLQDPECNGVAILSAFGITLRDQMNDNSPMQGAAAGNAPIGGEFSAENSNSSTPTLDEFGRDLTKLAKENKIDPVIGRENEIERVIQILSRRTKNNPCLIGEPGVGKTAIAEGLALKIVKGEVPELLKDKRIVTLDLTGMIAGTKYRGDFEERIKKAVDEVKNSGDTIANTRWIVS